MTAKKATLIYLEDCVLLSKKEYLNWREIQDEYYDEYKASLSPMTYEEIIFFFEDDFGDEQDWPISKKTLIDFFESDKEIIKSE